jgi:hypothetical protein
MSLNRLLNGLAACVFACTLLSANTVYAQMGSYSIYNDGAVGMDGGNHAFFGWGSIDDTPPQGCDHINYNTTTTVQSPSRSNSALSGGMSSSSWMTVDGEEGYWNVGTEAYVFCTCAGTDINMDRVWKWFNWDLRIRITGYNNCTEAFAPLHTYRNVYCDIGTSATCNDTPFQDPIGPYCSIDVTVAFLYYKHGSGPWTCSQGASILTRDTGSASCS